MGLMHEMGKGVKLDVTHAFNLYKLAYDNGSISGARNLGILFEHGIATDQDFINANNLYKYAASLGDPIASHKLSKFHSYK
jgi:TPR repeat protein